MIADDLTGACDAAAAFARHGFRAAVLPAAGVNAWPAGFEMIVLPTFSRDDEPAAARRKVEEACALLAGRGIRLIYKKIDSTLKGNLAAEIDAVLAGGGFSSAVVTPAFPAMGRTVADGVLQVAGRATSLHVPTLLADVRGAQPQDAASDRELRDIAAAAMASDGQVLCVGSGGLAAQLADLLAGHFGRTARDQVCLGRRGPALFVMGSEQPATRAQVDYLLRNRPAHGHGLDVDPQQAATAFREGCHLVVTADPAKSTAAGAGRLLAVAQQHLSCGLAVSGGDTAEWISRAAAVSVIELQGEVLPGIPWGEAVSSSGQKWRLVTKAGGFGAEDALALVADFLMGEKNKRAC
jgi:uncharacterized protein YgbK (DUF1537 family)